MPVDYQFKRGVDVPTWVWLQQFPGLLVSKGLKYDEVRYIYCAQATGFFRYDTWTNSWHYLAVPTTGGAGQDIVYDAVRNVVLFIHGYGLNSWQVFNLNTTAVTYAGVVCQPWVLTTMTPILPVGAATGSWLSMPRDYTEGIIQTNGVAATTGNTTTNIASTLMIFTPQMIGLRVRVTSGVQNGVSRLITGRVDGNDLTVLAFPGALASGDTFVIERPGGTSSAAGTTTTLIHTGQTWIVNKYTNWDVEIISGTGVGQRRRIASNTTDTITLLAAAIAGNARTGPFVTAPDATSVYRIVPSTDFLYYQVGNAATFYKLDVVAIPAAVWTALTSAPAIGGAGASGDFSRQIAPGHIYMLRSVATATIYVYDIGLNTWITMTHYPPPGEVFSTGASMVLIPTKNKLVVYRDSSQRVLAVDLATGIWEGFGNHPYIAGTNVEGKHIEYVMTNDGVEWLYLMRAGNVEFFRVALEWL